jgi:folate-binding protein YgfZ
MSQTTHIAALMGKVVDLRDRCVFELTGPDRVRYLNGQVTNNVAKIQPGQTMFALVANQKGKIEAEIGVRIIDDALRLDAPSELRESLWLRLNKYLIADDCEWSDVTENWQLTHRLGQGSDRRFFTPGEDVWETRNSETPSAGNVMVEELDWLCVSQGVPRWGRELSPEIFPQEARLDETHVDFHKGCYLGQEIISRLRSVGQVQKQLEHFELVSGAASVGDLVVTSTGEKAGTLTTVTIVPQTEKRIALGYLKRTLKKEDLTFSIAGSPDAAPAIWRVMPDHTSA